MASNFYYRNYPGTNQEDFPVLDTGKIYSDWRADPVNNFLTNNQSMSISRADYKWSKNINTHYYSKSGKTEHELLEIEKGTKACCKTYLGEIVGAQASDTEYYDTFKLHRDNSILRLEKITDGQPNIIFAKNANEFDDGIIPKRLIVIIQAAGGGGGGRNGFWSGGGGGGAGCFWMGAIKLDVETSGSSDWYIKVGAAGLGGSNSNGSNADNTTLYYSTTGTSTGWTNGVIVYGGHGGIAKGAGGQGGTYSESSKKGLLWRIHGEPGKPGHGWGENNHNGPYNWNIYLVDHEDAVFQENVINWVPNKRSYTNRFDGYSNPNAGGGGGGCCPYGNGGDGGGGSGGYTYPTDGSWGAGGGGAGEGKGGPGANGGRAVVQFYY